VSTEGFDYLKVVAILCVIAGLAYVVLRFWLPRVAFMTKAASGPLAVTSRMTLEARKTLYVIRAGSAYLVLAASDAGVQFLTSLDAAQVDLPGQDSTDK
jgi:flagellar biogenesis protein FliO